MRKTVSLKVMDGWADRGVRGVGAATAGTAMAVPLFLDSAVPRC